MKIQDILPELMRRGIEIVDLDELPEGLLQDLFVFSALHIIQQMLERDNAFCQEIGILRDEVARRDQNLAIVRQERDETDDRLRGLRSLLSDKLSQDTDLLKWLVKPADMYALDQFILKDRKIDAIKLVRTHTGIGLKEAKDLVEARKADINLGKVHPVTTLPLSA